MAVLLWCVSLMLAALLWAIGPARRPTPAPAAREVWAPPEPLAVAPPRPSVRPALQTSAALLAIALALDVSGAPQAWVTPAETAGAYATLAEETFVLPQAAPPAWAPVEMAADWSFKAVSATDGWLI